MATTYNVPTDETLASLVTAVSALSGTNVHGGHVYFYSSRPAESDVPARPALVVVTTTGEVYMVSDDYAAAKASAWAGEEEEAAADAALADATATGDATATNDATATGAVAQPAGAAAAAVES